ncbi:hypothetical protein [Mycolicibacterium houstonense]|uniref:hypothetical protein n=1 Tax=Mycolicibacterium houstonense TaxID=146021 RepID=UPI000835A952|nr:hypothetical protein [Mycolicibacterium houstonense]
MTAPFPVDDSPTIPIVSTQDLAAALGWDLDGDGDIEGIETKIPEPAVVRGLGAAVLPIIGWIVGKSLDVAWIDQAVAAYAVVAPVVLGFLIRSKVTPVKK